MKRVITALTAVLLLTSCSAPDPFSVWNDKNLSGQPEHVVSIAKCVEGTVKESGKESTPQTDLMDKCGFDALTDSQQDDYYDYIETLADAHECVTDGRKESECEQLLPNR